MLKFAEKLVKLRIPILILAAALLVPAGIGFITTKVNYDILYYLPDDIETMKGQDILLNEFGKGAYGMFVCDNMDSADAIRMVEKLESIDHVAEVISFDNITGGKLPAELLPAEVRKIFYSEKGNSILMFMCAGLGLKALERAKTESYGKNRRVHSYGEYTRFQGVA